MRRAAAVFDMDGVLIDNHALHQEAWRRFCKEEGLSLSDRELRRLTIGRRTSDALPLVCARWLSPEDLSRLVARRFTLFRELATSARLVPGVAAFLADLCERRVPCALATSAPADLVTETLGRFDLGASFVVCVTASDVTCGKPDSEVYLKAAKRLEVPASTCVAFDDALIGVEAAYHAGMTAVGVATAHSQVELVAAGATLVIRDFTRLTWAETYESGRNLSSPRASANVLPTCSLSGC